MGKLIQTNIVAGVVIKQDGKYLLVQENRPGTKVHGLWNFPAGRVEKGYTIEETAVKEAKEEAGYDVELIRKLGIFQTHAQTPPKHAFEAKIVGGNLQWPLDEILDARWFAYEEIKGMKDKLREEWIIGAISIMESNNIMEQPLRPKVGVGFGIMLLKDGKILLGRRHADPEKADSELHGEGTWTMPGGKLEYGETFEEGAKREVLEETGINLDEVKVICVNNDKNEHAHFVTIGLFSDKFKGEAKVMEPDEIVEWNWFRLDDLPRPLFFPSANMIENYKKREFYIP